MSPRKKNPDQYPTYEQTKLLLKENGINTVLEYRKFYHTSEVKIPYHPERVYANSWINWTIFFSKHKTQMVSYVAAKILVRSQNIQTMLEYENWYKECDHRLPSAPAKVYVKDWKGWNNFLHESSKFVSYEEASKLTIQAGIKTCFEYTQWYRTARKRLPAAPQIKYAEWTGWGDFLGKT